MANHNRIRDGVSRDDFARLLDGFLALVAHQDASDGPSAAGFRVLLDQFSKVRDRSESLEHAAATDDHKRIEALLEGYDASIKRYRSQQENSADDFSLLEVLQLTSKETRHSMALAWLLDHDLRKLGTHAQGNLGFRLFLEQLKRLGLSMEYADCNYWVRREVVGDESIVDVEIGCRGRFLIHIENKIWSSEGADQTDREWADLQRRAADLNVGSAHAHALFLTPNGATPKNPRFRAIRWGHIAEVLDEFALQAKPKDVKLFAEHYARGLRRFIVTQDRSEGNDAETTDERG